MTKLAIIGLGKMGLSHLAIANATPNVTVAAIVDKSSLVGGAISRYGKFKHFTGHQEAISAVTPDAVVIATPSRSHEAIIRDALEQGIHVFCEKPLTLSSVASDELASIAEERGLVTQVGYHNRFIGTFAEVKRLLDLKVLGRVSNALAEAYGPVVLRRSKATWRSSAGEGGGCLNDYAAHPINLLNWFFGEASAASGSHLKRLFSEEVEDEVYSALNFSDDVTALLSVNWSDESVRKMTTKITIWGEYGRIIVDRQELQVYLRKEANVPAGYNAGWTVRNITELTPPVSYYLRGEEYSAQMEAFATAIQSGKATISDFRSAAATDRAIELIRMDAENLGNPQTAPQRAAPIARQQQRNGFVKRLFGQR
jgi:scyllo-inositol 2-dehydrogenase (NADP+)